MVDVKTIREKLGLSQIELAAELGVSQTMISRLETAAIPVNRRTELALEALAIRSNEQEAA